MMLSVQCPNCGLTNSATHTDCVRCYTPLPASPFVPGQTPASNLRVITPIKLVVGGALLLFLVVVGGMLTYYLGGRRSVANRNVALEQAISVSPEFNVPVAVEAGRYTFYNRDASRFDQ